MSMLLQELKNFSKANLWIFFVLALALWIVIITWKWNPFEILILFLVNFCWNLCIMVMQENYTKQNNRTWAYYHVFTVIIFTSIASYWFLFLWQSQYIIWQIAYTAAAAKAFFHYNYQKNITLINEKSWIILNIVLFSWFLLYFQPIWYQILQWIGFSLVTTWLMSIKDSLRYWLNIFGIFGVTSGSLWGVIHSYQLWSLDGIALAYFLLTLTVFLYYIKLLKKYIV